jgi:hypothetical protein
MRGALTLRHRSGGGAQLHLAQGYQTPQLHVCGSRRGAAHVEACKPPPARGRVGWVSLAAATKCARVCAARLFTRGCYQAEVDGLRLRGRARP